MKVGSFKPLPTQDAPKSDAPRVQRDPRLQQAAEMYEKQFLREMVKAMRSTVMESDFVEKSQGERIFREQLDDQYVEKWGDSGGIGLADVIYNQIEERFGSSVKLPAKKSFKLGPMPLAPQRSQPHISQTPSGLDIRFKADAPTQALKAPATDSSGGENTTSRVDVHPPMNGGVLLAQGQYDELTRWARVAHDNGFVSDIRFQGEHNHALQVGQSLPPDTSLGNARIGTDVLWSLRK